MTPHSLFRRILPACALMGLLAACISPPLEPKKPQLAFTPVTHDVYYSNYTVIPSQSEDEALNAFLQDNGQNPGGNIALLAAEPQETKTAERLQDLQGQLELKGYSDVLIVQDATVPQGRIRVSTSSVKVTTPDCPDWSYAYMANYRNAPLSNHGCAHVVNLSKMVLDPNDLVSGAGDSSPDAARAQGIIELYRAPPEPAGGSDEPTEGQ